MIPQLGLVCITCSDEVRYRAMTRKRLLEFDEEIQRAMLRQLYVDNLGNLLGALHYCVREGIRLYRFTAKLFPFVDMELGREVMHEMADEIAAVGAVAHIHQIRLVVHPEQFVVLNSENPTVIDNSIKILTSQAEVMDLLGLPHSPWAMMEIHGGKGGQAERLVETIGRLPEGVRTRLALENDEHIYSAAEILHICQAAYVPMVFDAHHHIVSERLDSYEHESVAEMVAAARETWTDPTWQVVHISNGRDHFADRRHHDLIMDMPSSYAAVPWIEVEAKAKEIAIAKLRAEWEPIREHYAFQRS